MSWFRNVVLFRRRPGPMDPAAMAKKLESFKFQPCGDLDMETAGFVPVMDGGDLVFNVAGGHMFLSICTERKQLPKQVIDRKTRERCDKMEEDQGFKPGRKQTKEIREQVLDELLPKAFTTRAVTRAWIDTKNGWFAVDTPTHGRASDFILLLMKALDGFDVNAVRTNQTPRFSMTEWLSRDEAPSGFTVDQDTELQSSHEGKPTVRYVRHTLEADDLNRHIAAGKSCTRLALTWADKISFVFTDSFIFKQVAPLDIMKENGSEAANDYERKEADFVLMAGELNKLFNDMVDALGGEVEAEEN